MSWDMLFAELKNQLPPFNEYLLEGYRKDMVNSCADFMGNVYNEAMRLFDESVLSYKGYRILSPEERIKYIANDNIMKKKFDIQTSELQMVEYQFFHNGNRIPVPILLPYYHNGAIVMRDISYYLQLAITDRVIYRTEDGVVIRVMRSPLQFWRNEQMAYTSTSGETFYDLIITTQMHYKENRSKTATRTPLLLYLLAQYGFETLMTTIFGLSRGDISFTKENDQYDQTYLYFQLGVGDIYLRVHKENVMRDLTYRRVVASLLLIVNYTRRYTVSDLYNDLFYKKLLGSKLYRTSLSNENLAIGHANTDLKSLSTYLDKYSKKRLEQANIYCKDVFELLVTTFVSIDQWLDDYAPNDLFAKKLSGTDLLLRDMVEYTFKRVYKAIQQNKDDSFKKNPEKAFRKIRTMLKMNSSGIYMLYKIPGIQANSSLYNDNVLLSTLIKKVRVATTQKKTTSKSETNLITSKEHQFHPSFLAIESALAISSSSPGVSGDINPYVVIDRDGYFHKELMPWYDEILPLSRYLISV